MRILTQNSETETVKSSPGSSSNNTNSGLGNVNTGQKANPHSQPNSVPSEKGDERWKKEKEKERKERMEVEEEDKEMGRKEKEAETGVRSAAPVAAVFAASDIREKEVKSEEIANHT